MDPASESQYADRMPITTLDRTVCAWRIRHCNVRCGRKCSCEAKSSLNYVDFNRLGHFKSELRWTLWTVIARGIVTYWPYYCERLREGYIYSASSRIPSTVHGQSQWSLTNTGIQCRGASTSIHCPPSYPSCPTSSLWNGNHFSSLLNTGKYALTLRWPSWSTGQQRNLSPYMYWMPIFQHWGSSGNW